jgi:hypothetical protein
LRPLISAHPLSAWVTALSLLAAGAIAAETKGSEAPAPPAPQTATSLTPEDLELLRELDLLEDLELLRSWDPEEDLPIPAGDKP